LHYKKGELEKAKEYYDRAFEIGKEELGLNSDDVAHCSDNFGRMCDGACDLKKEGIILIELDAKHFDVAD
jgi:tetratricopeptide (TPR) repeat protein